jgi:tetratricopeptide (TPR) repeat protein
MLAYLLLPFLFQTQGAVPEPSGRWCSPVTANVTGKVTVHCIGVDPRAMDVLNVQLERTSAQLDEKIRIANTWAEKYKLLEKRLAEAGDTSPLSRQAQDLLHKGQFQQAGAVLDRIIAQEQKTLDRLAADHYNRALIYELQFDTPKALIHLEKAYRFAPESWRYGAEYARALGVENRMVEEEAVYRAFMERGTKNAKAEDIPYAALMLTGFARFAVQKRQYDTAEKSYKLALEGLMGMVRVDPSKFLETWLSTTNELGSLYETMGRFEDAEDQYARALTTEKLGSEGEPTGLLPYMSSTWARIGDTRHERGDYKGAMEAYWKAFGLLGEAGGDLTRFKPQGSAILQRIGRMALEYDKFLDVAETSFETVVKNYRELGQQDLGAYRPKLAEALDDLGSLYLKQNKFEECEKSYKESLEIKQQLATTMPEVSQADLASSFNHLAALYEQEQKLDQANAAIDKELQIFRQLYAGNNAGYVQPLLQAVNNQGLIAMELKNWPQALKSSTEARELSSPLVPQAPRQFAAPAITALYIQAAAYTNLQNPLQAESSYVEMLKITWEQTQRDPNTFETTLAAGLKTVADFYEGLGRLDDALKYSREATALYRKMRPDSPQVGPAFSKALLAQADILLKRKTDCTEIIPVLNEAETQADSLQGKQSARQLLQSCTDR